MADSADDVFLNAEESLKTAVYGLKRAKKSKGRAKIVGIRNAITFGRSVTNILEKAEHHLSGEYKDWLQDKKDFVQDDEVCRAIGKARNEIIHEGTADISPYVKVDHLNSDDLMKLAPEWADSVFLGDKYGGSGFEVELQDGETKRFYIDLPDEIKVETGLRFGEVETLHDAVDDVQYYLKVMAEIVAEAKKQYGLDSG